MDSQGETFDVAILGGGSGGYVAAIRASQLGLRVALIEKEKLGGTCLHRGCIPTKALLESAQVHSLLQRAGEYGVTASDAGFDYSQMLRRKDAIVARLLSGIQFLMKKNRVTVLQGRGQLLTPTTLGVISEGGQEQEVVAKDVVLATGSVPKSLPGLEIDGQRILTSDHLLELPQVPASLVIVGGGAVGVEFASLYHDLGCQVTLVEIMPRLLPLEDQEIGKELERSFRQRGLRALTGARLRAETLTRGQEGVQVQVEVGGQKETLSGERLLVAVGRQGQTEGLGLEKLGARVERGYLAVDQAMNTGIPHLYAIGDLIGGLLLAHVAMAEGILAAEAIAGKETTPLDYSRVPRNTYCRPQVGSLGLSEEEAVAQGRQVKVGRFPFRANGRALIAGEGEGFVKVIAEAESGAVLGVHIIGPQASELIMEPALAKFLESTAWELGSSIHAHPTLAEAVGEAALAADGRAIHI